MLRQRYIVICLSLLNVNSLEVEWKKDAVIDVNLLSDSFDELMDQVIGHKQLQNYYDKLNFKQKTLNGTKLIRSIADNFGLKFFDRNNAIKRLKNIVQESLSKQSHFQECCHVDPDNLETDSRFKQGIGNEVCQRISDLTDKVTALYLTEKFQEECSKNLYNMASLRWQYFGSEAGITAQYPSINVKDCGNYDCRFRPFYVQASVPEAKDIVIVIDKSGSMNTLHSGTTLMDTAKEAAKTVVRTLNPQDRFAVIAFSSEVILPDESYNMEPCFSKQLSRATKQNINDITYFIGDIKYNGILYILSEFPYYLSLGYKGDTIYSKALESAFDYFDNSDLDVNREKVILFLSDGEPNDNNKTEIFNILKTRNERLNNSVILLTYGLGQKQDFQILKDLAKQNGDPYGISKGTLHENIKPGIFTRVKTPENLRQEMASYYRYFSKPQTNHEEPIWSLPYLDMWGLGFLMSVTLPVHNDDGHIIGVVGTDLTIDDLLAGATYLRLSDLSYMFIIDSTGLVIFHPLFRYSKDNEMRFIDIMAFEREPKMKSVIEDMKRGGSGYSAFKSQRILSDGNSRLYRVRSVVVDSQVYWTQIPHTKFAVCLVLAKNSKESTLQELDPEYGASFLYHRFDIKPPENACQHFQNLCTKNQSSVSLGPRAFTNTEQYLNEQETLEDITSIKNYLMTGKGGGSLKKGVRNSVWATQQVERLWKFSNNTEMEKYILWRYIGTKEGVFRIYPGAELPKKFDPIHRMWYQRAVSNNGDTAFTTAYKDAVTGKDVIALSKVIYEGRPSGKHNRLTDKVIAVVGVDVALEYLEQLLKSLYPTCFDDVYRCLLIDTAGFVVYDHLGTTTKGLYPTHITDAEPFIAQSLIEKGKMIHEICINMEYISEQRTYKITEQEIFMGKTECFNYQLFKVQRTNIFLVVRQIVHNSCESGPSNCFCSSFLTKIRKCVTDGNSCECPCTAEYTNYNTCQNKFYFNGEKKYLKPCSPESDQGDWETNQANKEDLKKLPVCFEHSGTKEKFLMDEHHRSLSGAIAGGIIGGILALIILVVLIHDVIRRIQKTKKTSQQPSDDVFPRHSITKEPLPPPPIPATFPIESENPYINASAP